MNQSLPPAHKTDEVKNVQFNRVMSHICRGPELSHIAVSPVTSCRGNSYV